MKCARRRSARSRQLRAAPSNEDGYCRKVIAQPPAAAQAASDADAHAMREQCVIVRYTRRSTLIHRLFTEKGTRRTPRSKRTDSIRATNASRNGRAARRHEQRI